MHGWPCYKLQYATNGRNDLPVEMWAGLMVCNAASASSKAGLAASSFSSATTLSAYSVKMTHDGTGLPQHLCNRPTNIICKSSMYSHPFQMTIFEVSLGQPLVPCKKMWSRSCRPDKKLNANSYAQLCACESKIICIYLVHYIHGVS